MGGKNIYFNPVLIHEIHALISYNLTLNFVNSVGLSVSQMSITFAYDDTRCVNEIYSGELHVVYRMTIAKKTERPCTLSDIV